MPIIQNGKKQKMIYKNGFPISKIYKGTILLFRATDVLSVGGGSKKFHCHFLCNNISYREWEFGQKQKVCLVNAMDKMCSY